MVILGPDVLIEETGRLSINAGQLVTIMTGLEVEEGSSSTFTSTRSRRVRHLLGAGSSEGSSVRG